MDSENVQAIKKIVREINEFVEGLDEPKDYIETSVIIYKKTRKY